MRNFRNDRKRAQSRRAGLSLIEVSISTILVGFVLVGAMRCVGGVIKGRTGTSDQTRAQLLAQQLMTEILHTDYVDGGLVPLFGPELGEPLTLTGPRSGWDDVDDFHQWSASPPEDRDGTALSDFSGWERSVAVAWVDPADPADTSLLDQGVKRITVTVRRNGVLLATLICLRTEDF